MNKQISGYHGVLLEVDLSSGKIGHVPLSPEDASNFVGGRGLGIKILWDRLKKPGLNALSPENPLMFLPGPFSGFPIPSASRTCVVTKSTRTSPLKSKYPDASTLSYSNIGGFIGPEIRFAGYDGIIITGKADSPVYLYINDDKVEIRDARKFRGMKTYEFEKVFSEELGDRKFETCFIGPAGENLVSYAAILHTIGRAAGRGGVGCVMGSKNLKAIAVKGTGMPEVTGYKNFIEVLEETRKMFRHLSGVEEWIRYGTAAFLMHSSDMSRQSVKNFREGTFLEVDKIAGIASEQKTWIRDMACYCCPIGCKKIGVSRDGQYGKFFAEGPEYETGTMVGANLLISDLEGMMKEIADIDEYGLDQISTGNVIGFLMECYEKGYIDKKFLDGIDLKWGDVGAALALIKKITYREGIGDLASMGVKKLADEIGQDSHKIAIHCKGHELAAHNVHANPPMALSYATSTRGACHLAGNNAEDQNFFAATDSTGQCFFSYWAGFSQEGSVNLLSAVTGKPWSSETYLRAGERIFNLEKCFNYREGFKRTDDSVPDRFFEEPFTYGPEKGAVLDRNEFEKMMDNYYLKRGWDPETTRPSKEKLISLGLEFAWEEIKDM